MFNNNGNNIDISKLKGKELRDYRKKVSMIFQDFNLLNQKNDIDIGFIGTIHSDRYKILKKYDF